MALVHDLAECIVGDYTPGQVSDEQKFTEEEVIVIEGIELNDIKYKPLLYRNLYHHIN
jgi:5'-deoxynucleotidase YfbR-like HD superfamily hydrolase